MIWIKNNIWQHWLTLPARKNDKIVKITKYSCKSCVKMLIFNII